jgi:hypothetical protein
MREQWTRAEALAIQAEILKIKRAKGSITNAYIVEAARKEDSPLHEFFEWNDGKAAESYRRQQAGELVHRIRVVITGEKSPPKLVSITVQRDKEEDRPQKSPRPREEPSKEEIISRALAQLEGWVKSWEKVDELKFARVKVRTVTVDIAEMIERMKPKVAKGA